MAKVIKIEVLTISNHFKGLGKARVSTFIRDGVRMWSVIDPRWSAARVFHSKAAAYDRYNEILAELA